MRISSSEKFEISGKTGLPAGIQENNADES